MKIIELDSVKNIRDFSYDNIKNNLLLRSAAIDNITQEDFNNYMKIIILRLLLT